MNPKVPISPVEPKDSPPRAVGLGPPAKASEEGGTASSSSSSSNGEGVPRADAAPERPLFPIPLNWVGMEGIEIPLLLPGGLYPLPASVDVFVNLIAAEQRGIHMSRLYQEVLEWTHQTTPNVEPLGRTWNGRLLKLVQSQKGLANQARVKLRWKGFWSQKSLITPQAAGLIPWEQRLDLVLRESQNVVATYEMKFVYSSTCPASAALSREALVESLEQELGSSTDGTRIREWLLTKSVATPHAQRSQAHVEVELRDEQFERFFAQELHNQMRMICEKSLGTSVQSYVKRSDEKEFARRNAQNLMFCEDALRRLISGFQDFRQKNCQRLRIHVEHIESLHPHSASAQHEW